MTNPSIWTTWWCSFAQFAEEGDVVIMGRGSQYILRDHPDAIHILLVNPVENRIKNIMERHDPSHKKAEQMVQSEDKRRAVIYKKIGKTDYEQAGLYDLTVNLGRVEADTAREMIVELARHKAAENTDMK